MAQKITITASSNLSDEDIDRAVKEAEKYAEEDKKRKEEVEIRNNAESLVYQCEKAVKDAGDKIDDNTKSMVETEVNKVKEALKGTDSAAIKAATDELQEKFYAVAQQMYQQANPQGDPNAQQGAPNDDGVYELTTTITINNNNENAKRTDKCPSF